MNELTPWRTTAQVAVMFQCDPRTVRRAVKMGQLKAKKIGSDYRFHIDDLNRR